MLIYMQHELYIFMYSAHSHNTSFLQLYIQVAIIYSYFFSYMHILTLCTYQKNAYAEKSKYFLISVMVKVFSLYFYNDQMLT